MKKNDYNITEFQFFKKLTQLDCIEEIYLYGSRARNSHRDRSDIDLAIVCPKATKDDWYAILNVIDEADTLLEIDCVRLDKLSPTNALRKSINQDGIIVYKKDTHD